jgi:glycosyltransferase involved in cell wall biosynthesis
VKLLWIGTKAPSPPVDGGRLLTLLTLRALAARGVEVTLVAPGSGSLAEDSRAAEPLGSICRPRLVPVRPRSPLLAGFASLAPGPPYSIRRHRLAPVRHEVASLLARETYDVVHVEQLQAFPQAAPALESGLPVVLRAQNVESDIWWAARAGRPLAGLWLARQARRLAGWEGEAIRQASAVVALTEEDAGRLQGLARGREVLVVRAPFPAELPCGMGELAGAPALVVLGSAGWFPNQDAADWFTADIWPEVRRRTPAARLHLFGSGPSRGPGIELHPVPEDSRLAFAPGSVMVVPLRIASGVRMKILEAWARGVPVVATPTAAAGLGAEDGRQLLLANDAPGFARAVERLAVEPGLAASLTAAGRRLLVERHDPGAVAERLADVYGRTSIRLGAPGGAALAS